MSGGIELRCWESRIITHFNHLVFIRIELIDLCLPEK